MALMVDWILKIVFGREAWRLKVCVIHMWTVPMYNNALVPSSLEMVLMDEIVRFPLFIG